MADSRSFKIALLLSCLLHIGAFMAIGQDLISEKLLTPPQVALKENKPPKMLHFELVKTPSSAQVATPPENTNLMSDKNTRAQDQFQGNQKLRNAPHMVGKNEDSKDTRPKMSAPQPLPKPAQPQSEIMPPKEITKRADEKPLEKLPEKMKEAAEVLIEPKPYLQPSPESASEPPKPDIIRLAKKSADTLPHEAISSPSLSPADSRNMDADAEITGELSYAASRHFFGEYLLKMKEAVERQWISQLITKYTGIVSSRAVIDFKIQPDGRVSDMAVNSSDGDPYFPLVCVASINEAQPFGNIPYQQAYGLPDHLMNKPLNIRFTFQYN